MSQWHDQAAGAASRVLGRLDHDARRAFRLREAQASVLPALAGAAEPSRRATRIARRLQRHERALRPMLHVRLPSSGAAARTCQQRRIRPLYPTPRPSATLPRARTRQQRRIKQQLHLLLGLPAGIEQG